MSTSLKIGASALALLCVFFFGLLFWPNSDISNAADDGYIEASGNLWSGVTVYSRDKKPLFMVIGGNDTHRFSDGPARAIQVITTGQSTSWKKRDDLIKAHDYYFVKSDDPALAAKQWEVIRD